MDIHDDAPAGIARLSEVTDALDLVVAELVARRDDRPAAAKASFDAAQLRFAGCDRDEAALDDIVSDPVEWGMRAAVKAIGKHLHRITGSTNAMRGVAEAVCDRDPARRSRRMSAIAAAWDGIGTANDRWHA